MVSCKKSKLLQAFVLFLCCYLVRVPLSSPNHEVFISFRGKDTRNGFVSHLTKALERHNINFFIDTHELKGRDLKHLFKRIVEVPIVLVILSIRFGESTWCLEELKISMEQAARGEIIVIPIFYKVQPEDVRKNKGSFLYWFRKHNDSFGYWFWKGTKNSSREQKESWRDALNKVSQKHGIIIDENRKKDLSITASDKRRRLVGGKNMKPISGGFQAEEIPQNRRFKATYMISVMCGILMLLAQFT